MKSACELLESGDNRSGDKCSTQSASKSLRKYIKEYEKQESLEIARLVVKSCKSLNGRYFSNQTVNKPDSDIDDQIRKAREKMQVSLTMQQRRRQYNDDSDDDIYDLFISKDFPKTHQQVKESNNKQVSFEPRTGDGLSIQRNTCCPPTSGSPSKLRSSTPYDNSEISFSSAYGSWKQLPDINQSVISIANEDQSVTIDTNPNVLVGGKERDVFEHQNNNNNNRFIGDVSQLSCASSNDLVNNSASCNSNDTSNGFDDEDISIVMENIERRKKRLLRKDDESSIADSYYGDLSAGAFGNLLVDLDLDETICSSRMNPSDCDVTIPYNISTGNVSVPPSIDGSHTSSSSHISIPILPDDNHHQPPHIRDFMEECLDNSASEHGDGETTDGAEEIQQARSGSVEKLKNMIFAVQEFTLSSTSGGNSTLDL